MNCVLMLRFELFRPWMHATKGHDIHCSNFGWMLQCYSLFQLWMDIVEGQNIHYFSFGLMLHRVMFFTVSALDG